MNFATRFNFPFARNVGLLLLLLVGLLCESSRAQSFSGLKYDWKPGDEFHYDIELESEFGDKHDKKAGTLVYKVRRKKLDGFREGDSSGSAFVVGSDGYLATCAHVVGDAKKVEVKIGDQALTATVVEVNPVIDVALLKVDASNLKPLPLADSLTILQGKKISAFGFPLSGVLGEKVKVTNGIVSGFVDNVGGCRNLQFDAKVNPGNSGGPVVDEFGNCIGIVTSKLTGIAVSDVGFAVPSSELVKLVQKHSKSQQAFVRSQAVSGTDLVKMVSDSIALVKVKAEQHSTAFQIDWQGRLGSKSGKGTLIVDNNGEVTELTGELDLPFFFGPLAKIAIEPLGGSSAPRWESLAQTAFAIASADERQSPTSIFERYRIPPPISRYSPRIPSVPSLPRTPRYPGLPRSYPGLPPSYPGLPPNYPGLPPSYPSLPPSYPGLPPSYPGLRPSYRGLRGDPGERQTEVKFTNYSAIERTIFERSTKPDGSVLLKKTLEFQTTEKETDPFLSLTSTGNIEFDRQQNVPASAEFNGTLKLNKDSKSISVPVKLAYRKIDKSVVEARNKETAERLRLAKEAIKKRETVPDPATVKSLLADLDAGKSPSYVLNKIEKLAPVNELRDEIHSALITTSRESSFNSYQFDSAFKILKKYGFTQEDRMELLISAVEKRSSLLDNTTMRWLMKMPVKERFRKRVVKIANKSIKNRDRSVKSEAKNLLARWGKGNKDANRTLLANARQSLNSDMSTYERKRELESMLKFDFSEDARPEATEIAKQALFTSGKDTTFRDFSAKLVLHCASPEDQLSIFCDYLVDVNNTLGDEVLKQVYEVFSKLKSKVAQQVLIVRLRKQNYYKLETKALISMGPDCEPMLLKAHKKIPEIRPFLPPVLEFVGTEKSIPLMERLELDCHESYERGKIHDRRVRMLKRLQLNKVDSGTSSKSPTPSAADKLGEMFGD